MPLDNAVLRLIFRDEVENVDVCKSQTPELVGVAIDGWVEIGTREVTSYLSIVFGQGVVGSKLPDRIMGGWVRPTSPSSENGGGPASRHPGSPRIHPRSG